MELFNDDVAAQLMAIGVLAVVGVVYGIWEHCFHLPKYARPNERVEVIDVDLTPECIKRTLTGSYPLFAEFYFADDVERTPELEEEIKLGLYIAPLPKGVRWKYDPLRNRRAA